MHYSFIKWLVLHKSPVKISRPLIGTRGPISATELAALLRVNRTTIARTLPDFGDELVTRGALVTCCAEGFETSGIAGRFIAWMRTAGLASGRSLRRCKTACGK